MTPAADAPRHDSRYCGAPKRQGEGTCTRPAGWGTPHPGIGACKLHAGSTPSHVAAAQRVQAEQLVQSLIWDLDAPPITDPVAALQSLAGRLDNAARVLGARLENDGVDLDSATAVVWARILRELRQALEGMERLGIASRGLEITEQLAGELGSAVRRVLDRLELDERQSLLVPVVVPEELRRIVVELPGPQSAVPSLESPRVRGESRRT